MASKLPAWFPLPSYAKKLEKKEWINAITWRCTVASAQKVGRMDNARLENLFIEFIDSDISIHKFKPSFPIAPLSAADAAVFAASWSTTPEWMQLFNYVSGFAGKKARIDEFDNVKSLHENEEVSSQLLSKHGWFSEEICHGLPISVDPWADDETLKLAFEVWLAGLRSAQEYQMKKPFDQKDFDQWHRFQILAVHDLKLWQLITGEKLTLNAMANAIWPAASMSADEADVDVSERLRKVAAPLMESIINFGTVRRLEREINTEDLLDKVVAEDMERRGDKKIPELRANQSVPE